MWRCSTQSSALRRRISSFPVFEGARVVYGDDDDCQIVVREDYLSASEADELLDVSKTTKPQWRQRAQVPKRRSPAAGVASDCHTGRSRLRVHLVGGDLSKTIPSAWVPELRALTDRVNAYCADAGFNAIFANRP